MVNFQPKCDRYWPAKINSPEHFGPIQVTLLREDVLSSYTVRTLKIHHTRLRCAVSKQAGSSSSSTRHHADRYVLHYHYTSWPDDGSPPDDPLPLLSFVRKSASSNRECGQPVVVHCSAGVGRTGVYIVVDAMLKQMKAKCELGLVPYLRHIRTQRNFMVQTEEQYVFIHDALAETVAAGETSVSRTYLAGYAANLQSTFTTDENSVPWQLIDRQFQLVSSFQPDECQYQAALRPTCQLKNQSFDHLPLDATRVVLTPRGSSSDGSDYINATWMPGFRSAREFIVTQHPRQQTIPDFWRMLWEHSSRTVIVLSSLEEPVIIKIRFT